MLTRLVVAHLSLFLQTSDGLVLQPSDGRVQNSSGQVLQPKPHHGQHHGQHHGHQNNSVTATAGDCPKYVAGVTETNCYKLALTWCDLTSSDWMIHGLWPQMGEYCETEYPFDKEDASAVADINKAWNGCSWGSRQGVDFWEYEWVKHGSCALNTDGKSMTETEYFTKAVELWNTYKGNCPAAQKAKDTCNLCFSSSWAPITC